MCWLMPVSKRQRLIAVWSAGSILLMLVLALVVGLGQAPETRHPDDPVEGLTSVLSRDITEDMVSFRFDEVGGMAGIAFQHFPARRSSLLPEDMGSGVAWGDYDNDGDPDLFLVNFAGSIQSDIVALQQPVGRHGLYRNNGDGTFTDVTTDAGFSVASFGMGATWADYDNDDDLDLYLTNYGANTLFRNDLREDGSRTFTDVTVPAGVSDARFSAGSAWGDYDNDGLVDLYVANYVDFIYHSDDITRVTRQYGSETPYTLNPSTYAPLANSLYRNNGDGTFTDVAPGTPVLNPDGRSMGAVWFDFDLDGHIDLYVANDVSDNGVFRNNGDGTFTDIGASSLAADYRGAMGLAVGDYEHDGDLDLFVTHWIAQENAFFENMHAENWKDDAGNRRLFFMDSAEILGLGQISLKMVGWSTGFADFDNDRYQDLWVTNGSTLETPEQTEKLKPQQLQLYRHQPGKGFFEIGSRGSSDADTMIVGRGGAHADFDGDGHMDLAVMAHGESPRLFRNTSANDHHWIKLRLRQEGLNTRALGARVTLRHGNTQQLVQVGADGAYLSQHDLDIHLGLGADRKAEATVVWPDGETVVYPDLAADTLHTLRHAPRYH